MHFESNLPNTSSALLSLHGGVCRQGRNQVYKVFTASSVHLVSALEKILKLFQNLPFLFLLSI